MISLDLGPSYSIGRIVITPNAITKVPHEDLAQALNLPDKSKLEHPRSEGSGATPPSNAGLFRSLAAHRARNGITFWVITEIDRSVTLMLPEDYGHAVPAAPCATGFREIPSSCAGPFEDILLAPRNMVKDGQRFCLTRSSTKSPRRRMQETNSSEASMSTKPKQKPVHEVRIGFIKSAVWKNETEAGVRYNVTFSRLYKDGDDWKSTDSFGRDDLLLLSKVADQAHSWVCAQSAEEK